MNLNTQNKKFVSVSQHWVVRKGKEYQGKFIYVNPLSDEGKTKLETMSDLETLIEFHKWQENIHFSFTDSPTPQWGNELYQIDGNKLTFVGSNYDTSD